MWQNLKKEPCAEAAFKLIIVKKYWEKATKIALYISNISMFIQRVQGQYSSLVFGEDV